MAAGAPSQVIFTCTAWLARPSLQAINPTSVTCCGERDRDGARGSRRWAIRVLHGHAEPLHGSAVDEKIDAVDRLARGRAYRVIDRQRAVLHMRVVRSGWICG